MPSINDRVQASQSCHSPVCRSGIAGCICGLHIVHRLLPADSILDRSRLPSDDPSYQDCDCFNLCADFVAAFRVFLLSVAPGRRDYPRSGISSFRILGANGCSCHQGDKSAVSRASDQNSGNLLWRGIHSVRVPVLDYGGITAGR